MGPRPTARNTNFVLRESFSKSSTKSWPGRLGLIPKLSRKTGIRSRENPTSNHGTQTCLFPSHRCLHRDRTHHVLSSETSARLFDRSPQVQQIAPPVSGTVSFMSKPDLLPAQLLPFPQFDPILWLHSDAFRLIIWICSTKPIVVTAYCPVIL